MGSKGFPATNTSTKNRKQYSPNVRCELPPTLAKTACLAVRGFFVFVAGFFPLPFVGAVSEAISEKEPDE
jgi:hypothetical protein